jgi:hypothetical protein
MMGIRLSTCCGHIKAAYAKLELAAESRRSTASNSSSSSTPNYPPQLDRRSVNARRRRTSPQARPGLRRRRAPVSVDDDLESVDTDPQLTGRRRAQGH